MIIIESKRKKMENLRKKFPDAIIVDVTSKAKDILVQLSPFYPHGDIPVPNSGRMTATCVEAIWQGLKVFEKADIDINCFNNDTMKNLKRSSRKYGKVLGHRYGINGIDLLNYADARRRIYIPAYRWVLDYKVQNIIKRLRLANERKTIVLLDYNTNCDIHNYKKPLSHAFLVKAYAEGLPPYEDVYETIKIYHDGYAGSRFVQWETEEVRLREIERPKQESQLEIPFDFID